MPKSYKFVSVDRIFSKLERDITPTFNEDHVIEWIGEALNFIGTPNQSEQAVAFIEVKNHQCYVPKYCNSIMQIARDNKWFDKTKKVDCTPKKIIHEIQDVAFQKCNSCGDEDMGYVVLDGMGTPVLEYDTAYYRPYFDLKAEHLEFGNTNYFRGRYSPIRRATGSFFGELGHKDYDNNGVHSYNDDKYQVIKGEILRFSFCNGYVAVSFNRQVMDIETGYPMVPDEDSHTTAIVSYVTMKMMKKEFFRGKQGSDMRLKVANDDWTHYCAQATAVDMMPHSEDDYQNIGDMWNRMLPVNEYNNFFGSLANPEYRKFNDPDYRNIKNRVIVRP